MQRICTMIAIVLVLLMALPFFGGALADSDAGVFSWMESVAGAQDLPTEDLGVIPEAGDLGEDGSAEESGSNSQVFNVLAIIVLTLLLPYLAGM